MTFSRTENYWRNILSWLGSSTQTWNAWRKHQTGLWNPHSIWNPHSRENSLSPDQEPIPSRVHRQMIYHLGQRMRSFQLSVYLPPGWQKLGDPPHKPQAHLLMKRKPSTKEAIYMWNCDAVKTAEKSPENVKYATCGTHQKMNENWDEQTENEMPTVQCHAIHVTTCHQLEPTEPP